MDERVLNRRLLAIRIVAIVIFGVLVFCLHDLQIANGSHYSTLAKSNVLRLVPLYGPRGLIYDRKGRLLAKNLPKLEAVIYPYELPQGLEREKEVKLLGKILEISPLKIKKQILKQNQPYEPLTIKENISNEELAILSEQEAFLKGVVVYTRAARYYTAGKLLAHVLGYNGIISEQQYEVLKDLGYSPNDVVGKEGIEREYDYLLRGKAGYRQIKVDVAGNLIEVLKERQPLPGNNLYITIDQDFQEKVDQILEETLIELSYKTGEKKAGSIIVLNPKNGEILALVSKPGFDPNLFAQGISKEEYEKVIKHPWHPLLNRVVSCAYPPASTFKVVTMLAGLQEGIVTADTAFNCQGYFKLKDTRFNCWLTTGHKEINLVKGLIESCDVVFYNLGYRLRLEKIDEYSQMFGLGRQTGIDLPGEIGGILPTREWKKKNLKELWYTGDTINMSIGQGYLETTPLQMACVTALIANEGILYKPHILKKVTTYKNKLIRTEEPEISINLTKKIAKENFRILRNAMVSSVREGTGKGAYLASISVAGKTGTSETGNKNHTWFIAYAPAENPKLVVVVFLEQSGGQGGKIAVPVAKKVIANYFNLKEETETKTNGD